MTAQEPGRDIVRSVWRGKSTQHDLAVSREEPDATAVSLSELLGECLASDHVSTRAEKTLMWLSREPGLSLLCSCHDVRLRAELLHRHQVAATHRRDIGKLNFERNGLRTDLNTHLLAQPQRSTGRSIVHRRGARATKVSEKHSLPEFSSFLRACQDVSVGCIPSFNRTDRKYNRNKLKTYKWVWINPIHGLYPTTGHLRPRLEKLRPARPWPTARASSPAQSR
jgi:hypothetical protein